MKTIKTILALLAFFPCLNAQDINPFGNPVVPDMTADASIILIDDTFYYYATTDGYGRHLETSGPPVVWKSKDFVHWSFSGDYFPSAAEQKYWAPSKAIEANGKWYIYPTINGYMYPTVAESPEGPFRLARGEDKFELPYSKGSTLLQGDDRGGIDVEVFKDDNGEAYIFWGMRHVARLMPDMITLDTASITTLKTRRTEYSEGPIFFKRNGIYYYLYTIGGDERYEYYYMMSRVSPFGPYETSENDCVSTTNIQTGVFGPGHGCVFNDGDDYYFAFLEFGRNSTNRQTYVNRLEFNDDGTIRPVDVTLDGVGALRKVKSPRPLKPISATASSVMPPLKIRHFKDERCQRTESFPAHFALDGQNGSRWMAAADDSINQLTIDLGKKKKISSSEICFVRPTAGHAYILEGSSDGTVWEMCGGHSDLRKQSPHTDKINKKYRYLRITITEGIKGVWEWRVYDKAMKDKLQATSDQLQAAKELANRPWGQWKQWGEQPDGTFINPVIPSDYSDLDCIRVGDDYYAISSTMQYSPGMTILHSTDLVNWEIVGNAVPDLTQISQALNWNQMDRYGRGIWAGSIRYHNERFYILFGTPDEGYFITSSPKAEGPWEPLTPLMLESGWDDCTAIWDEEGQGYFLGTRFADNCKTYIFRMADDCRSIDRSSARLVNEGNHREANKLIRHGKYYYLVFSEHQHHLGRYVMCKRDTTLTGNFTEERQLLLPCRESNEPNQGGIIQGADDNWYFFTHHGTGDWSGRIASLLPVEWTDGWPMIGDRSKSEIGSMVWHMNMPKIEKKKLSIGRGGEFKKNNLEPWWQWNYQPRPSMYSLTERKGWLRQHAFKPLQENTLLKAGNTLTQRTFRSSFNEVIVKMDISHMADGQHAGLAHFASHSGALGVVREDGQCYLEFRENDQCKRHLPLTTRYLWIKTVWGLDGLATFAYSTDGKTYTPYGQHHLSWGYYRGDRIGIYCFNDIAENGYIDVDYLRYRMEIEDK